MKTKKTVLSTLIFSACVGLFPIAASAQLPLSLFGSSSSEDASFAPMLKKVTPAVVSITVQGRKEVKRSIPDIYRFFGYDSRQQYTEQRPFRGLGSGVIIDAKEGHIVTNNHVVDGADQIFITLKDGRKLEAKLIGADPNSDIALLNVESDNLSEMKIADSDKAEVGDIAIAIGNPFGLTQTVTAGIVSAVGRSNLNINGSSKTSLEDFIQTDAAINSGNSGGALVNKDGELIGINTAIYGPNGGNVGIGFAIPSNMMHNLVKQIIEFGEVRRGTLGVRGYALTSDLAEAMNLSVNQGAFVSEVLEDTPAQAAGLQHGDVITSINGVKIKGFGDLASKISSMGAGTTVKLGIIREGDSLEIEATLASVDQQVSDGSKLHEALNGAQFANGTTNDDLEGILVEEIAQRSPAELIGLEKGDIIIGINKTRTSNIAQLRTALKDASGVIAMHIQRGKNKRYILIR